MRGKEESRGWGSTVKPIEEKQGKQGIGYDSKIEWDIQRAARVGEKQKVVCGQRKVRKVGK